jgi:hypothetical protein
MPIAPPRKKLSPEARALCSARAAATRLARTQYDAAGNRVIRSKGRAARTNNENQVAYRARPANQPVLDRRMRCDCGSEHYVRTRYVHIRTKKHLLYLSLTNAPVIKADDPIPAYDDLPCITWDDVTRILISPQPLVRRDMLILLKHDFRVSIIDTIYTLPASTMKDMWLVYAAAYEPVSLSRN